MIAVVTGWGAVAASLLCLSAACVPHTPPTSPAASDHTWRIIGHRRPGVSAMDAADAEVWHGRFLHLQPQRATSGEAICASPSYRESTHPAAEFLAAEYRLPPAALGVEQAADVRVIDVSCQGAAWSGPGGRVLSFGPGAEFTVWDGVFFVLQRVHL